MTTTKDIYFTLNSALEEEAQIKQFDTFNNEFYVTLNIWECPATYDQPEEYEEEIRDWSDLETLDDQLTTLGVQAGTLLGMANDVIIDNGTEVHLFLVNENGKLIIE